MQIPQNAGRTPKKSWNSYDVYDTTSLLRPLGRTYGPSLIQLHFEPIHKSRAELSRSLPQICCKLVILSRGTLHGGTIHIAIRCHVLPANVAISNFSGRCGVQKSEGRDILWNLFTRHKESAECVARTESTCMTTYRC